MTIIQLFYHIIHFFGIGNFYIAEYKIPNYIKNKTVVITYTAFSFKKNTKNIKKLIEDDINTYYSELGKYIVNYTILKIW